jgi:hypothetical protein
MIAVGRLIMSVCAFVVVLVFTGQVAGHDRYGNPLGGQAAERSADAESRPPSAIGGSRRGVSPPPEVRGDDPNAVPTSSASAAGQLQPLTYDAQGAGSPPSPAARRSAPAATQDDGLGLTSGQEGTGLKPSAMIRAMLTAPNGARLPGRSITLDEVVVGAASRDDQSQRVSAYWDLCSSVADYYLGLREHEQLRRLKTLVTNVGPDWQQAESELGIRIGTSQRAAVASQYRLASLIGRAGEEVFPLPGDLPHCGDYYTRFDQVFADRQSAEAEQLSELLPLRYEELKGASTAVTRAEQWLDAVATQRTATTDGTGVLRALELLALRRRAFVQIVRDYNHRIARYAELATPGPIDSDLLIGMLIKREAAAGTATRSSTAVPPLNRQSQTTPVTPPPTFTEGWTPVDQRRQNAATRDEAVTPASAETEQTLRREHSLLVPSR